MPSRTRAAEEVNHAAPVGQPPTLGGVKGAGRDRQAVQHFWEHR